MNTKYLATIAAGFVLAVGMTACHPDQLTNLNTNPNSPTDAPPGPLFTAAVNTTVGRWLPENTIGILVQHWAETTYPQEDEYVNLQADRTSGLFDGPYTGELENLRKIVAKGQAQQQAGIYGPAQVLETWTMDNITDIFGDVPYSQALNGDSAGGSLKPAYDPQKDIYTGFFSVLSGAATAMAGAPAGAPGLGSADPIYGGDLGQWAKFANSLHARLAMRIVNADSVTADAELKAAFNGPGGVFTSNADNAKLVWPGDGVNDNPFANTLKQRDDDRLSQTLMNIMLASNDPRIKVFAQPVVDSSLYPNGYGGMPNGLTQDSAGKWFKISSRPGTIFYPGVTSYGNFGSSAGLATPSYLMTYSELMFIKAEAAQRGLGGLNPGEAAADYNAAITASLEQWGITDPAAISAFLADSAIAYKGGVAGLKQIAVQKWISLFENGVQAWSEWRRTCQPSTVRHGPATIVNFVPRRFFYSTTEASVNAENLNAAIARQGPDNFATRVWWDGLAGDQQAPTYVDDATCSGS